MMIDSHVGSRGGDRWLRSPARYKIRWEPGRKQGRDELRLPPTARLQLFGMRAESKSWANEPSVDSNSLVLRLSFRRWTGE